MEHKSKVLKKLSNLTINQEIQWIPFHRSIDDPNNPYMFHQHFMPELSYRYKIHGGIFYLASFRVMNIYPTYTEQLVLCFVTENKQEVISDNSLELLDLRKNIEKLFILAKEKTTPSEDSLSTELEAFLNS